MAGSEGRRQDTLQALVDRLIPADSDPSGSDAGVDRFITECLDADNAAHADLVRTGLLRLDAEAHAQGGVAFAGLPPDAADEMLRALSGGDVRTSWEPVDPARFLTVVAGLAARGFYGDPGNGGNHDGMSWAVVGYRAVPSESGWPVLPADEPPTTPWDAMADSYDAVVVGSGAGGGVAACVLAEVGHRVLLVERGSWLSSHDLRPDHLRNQRLVPGVTGDYETPAGPPSAGNPRVFAAASGEVVVPPTDPRWHNNAMTVGGGTRVYGAQAWRFCPEDFAMATTYGVPAGSSLADWPISYDDLERHYSRAEWEFGVSGDPDGNVHAGARSRPYPMPPVRPNGTAAALARGAPRLGLRTGPVPLLVNSTPYNGRGACIGCGACVGFGCPGEFKNDTRNTVIPRAVATGRCDVVTGAQAERIATDAAGRVTGVDLVTRSGSDVRRRRVAGRDVVLAAGAIETARLLLLSTSPREPRGLGNDADLVGRNLQGHVYAGAFGLFDEPVQDCVGPGPSIATNDYRHHNIGLVGGGMLANDFVMTPLQAWAALTRLGLIPEWGAAGKDGMRRLYRRLALVTGPVQETPNPESRVAIDPRVRDGSGVPVARLSGGLHPRDRATADFVSARAAEWLTASGATTVVGFSGGPGEGPSAGQHQAGTCRMGDDPATSVTDRWGRVWGHDNLHVADASLHVTNGGVNPVLTILALAYRVSERVAAVLSQRGGTPRR